MFDCVLAGHSLIAANSRSITLAMANKTPNGLSAESVRLAKSQSVRLYNTLQVARRLSVRSMTLMRWVVSGSIPCPKTYMCTGAGVHWLWSKGDIEFARAFVKKNERLHVLQTTLRSRPINS
jgi:hypothetical protein